MPERTISIAPVHLARAPLRLLAPSLILLVVAGVAGGAGLLLGGLSGIGLMAAAGVVAVLALYLALMVLRIRLEVEVATLRLHWPGGSRRYALARGPVTRVVTRGEGAARIRARFGAFGWAVGPARLRGTERIEVIRLAPSDSLILVPTDQGRLGIAAASEAELIEALGAAARVQQRLDAATSQVRVTAAPLLPAAEAVRAPAWEPVARLMTGIERAQLEERLAAERAAALAAAEAERLAAERAALEPASGLPPAAQTEPVLASTAARRTLPRPTLPRARRPAWTRVPAGGALPLGIAVLPAVAAGVLWLAAVLAGALPPEAGQRPLALAMGLVAAGLLGGLVARRWFPRLLGLVSVTSLAALVLVGRALFG